MNLRTKTDSTGALMLTVAAYTGPVTPATPMSNLRGRTDSNGYLLATIAGGVETPDSVCLDATNQDTCLVRDGAADTLALRRGTNPQTFRFYNTYANSGTDMERLNVAWASNIASIWTSASGTGSNRSLFLGTGNANNGWLIDTSGHLKGFADNVFDIGQDLAGRPRHVYVGTDVVVGSDLRIKGSSTTADFVNRADTVAANINAGRFQASTGYRLNSSGFFVSATAPTISSGFGSSPSIAASNGTAAFTINVGTGGTASNGVIGLPASTTGWKVNCTDLTTPGTNLTKQTAVSTTTATVTNYNSTTGVAAAWTASDILYCDAVAF
jgi:hypothetical protein